jgi:hypothetical protein
MIFGKVKIDEELRKQSHNPDFFLDAVNRILTVLQFRDDNVLERLKARDVKEVSRVIALDIRDEQNSYSLEDIEKVCVKYRLRFLDSGYFKPGFPPEAIQKISSFENKYQVKIPGFKIIAPSGVFDLQDINQDPLLFAPLGNDRFYLVHKWGCDLAWYRGLMSWPLKNFKNFFLTLVIAAAVIALSFPTSWLGVVPEKVVSIRLWLWAHFFIALFGFMLFIGSVFKLSFSSGNWDKKFFNN